MTNRVIFVVFVVATTLSIGCCPANRTETSLIDVDTINVAELQKRISLSKLNVPRNEFWEAARLPRLLLQGETSDPPLLRRYYYLKDGYLLITTERISPDLGYDGVIVRAEIARTDRSSRPRPIGN